MLNVLFYFHKNFSQALLCNILEVMCKQNFEQPFDTLSQISEANLTLYMGKQTGDFKQYLMNSSNPEIRKLAETMIEPKDYVEYFDLMENGTLSHGTHVELGIAGGWHIDIWEKFGRWTYLQEYNFGRGLYW